MAIPLKQPTKRAPGRLIYKTEITVRDAGEIAHGLEINQLPWYPYRGKDQDDYRVQYGVDSRIDVSSWAITTMHVRWTSIFHCCNLTITMYYVPGW